MTLLKNAALAACCLLAVNLHAAPLAVDPAQTYVNRDGTVAIVGNDGLEEVITQLNALFTRQHPQVRFSLRMEGSSAGMPALTAGATAFAPLTRDMWPGADGQATTGTDAEVVSGRYPYGRYVYLYVRRLPGQAVDPLAKEYLRLVLSREGQAILAAQPGGYLPLTAAQARTELEKLE